MSRISVCLRACIVADRLDTGYQYDERNSMRMYLGKDFYLHIYLYNANVAHGLMFTIPIYHSLLYVE